RPVHRFDLHAHIGRTCPDAHRPVAGNERTSGKSGGTTRAEVQKHGHAVGIETGRHDVGPSVRVQILDCDTVRAGTGPKTSPGLEGTVAVSQKHVHGVPARVRHGEVGPRIVVQISYDKA